MHEIIKVIDDWERALDNMETIHAVFFDQAKSVRPGEPQEADAETQETAPTISHIMDSRMAEW